MIELSDTMATYCTRGSEVANSDKSGLQSIRKITSERCIDVPEDQSKGLWLDIERARFIDKKRNLTINHSYLLGRLWLILDPLFTTVVYLFVFAVIRYRPDPGSVFVGLVLIKTLTECLRYGAASHLDFTAGLKIERIRTRAIVISEVIHISTKSLYICVGGLVVCLALGASPLLVVFFPILNIIHSLIWYSFGRLLSPIILRYRDFEKGIKHFEPKV